MPSALSAARPAAVALVLLAAVVLTGFVLYAFWPAGVALGLGLGIVAVLAIGARMQVSERALPADEDLAAQLGIELFQAPQPVEERPAAVVAEPAEEQEQEAEQEQEQEQEAEQAPVAEVAPVAERRPVLRPAEVRPARSRPARVRPAKQRPAAVEPVVASVVAEPAEPAEAEDDAEDALAPAPVLHAQPDVLYFTSDEDPDESEPRLVVADPVRTDLEHLKEELGDDYRDFARAARLVVSTQYASAARLQRDLDLPYSRARRLLADLEQQHFVGPATGSLPRQVLMPKERLPEVERLLTEA
ncbi:hypothetical protein GCM10025783_12610 [Amnibacterium soli]|uniref:FtsK gamma domain-containing protein n=1 Tax=Amnibacterium soli TaxID=1282736 RepID=A0ABP8YZW6_9MICO